ncbi:YlbF family regulator [Metabacillus arenae]|uniref:YlbF family regulator n=1 Tax=Metabacillus arenae TaxID=2771434 RepID=A0A926NB37_9BACI|nr:YlbF family regulator [Metabacillus arenae]MBD1380962.1 YlbF family regulator [Metabacillus arenae]
MFATIESVDILDKAEGLAGLILQTDEADEYRRCSHIIKTDKTVQKMIANFAKTKELYEDVQRFGKYHPDYKKLTKEMREVKRELDLNEHIAAFKKAEKELQSILDEVSIELGKAVSEHIKVPTGNPFFDSMSACSGGCGTGGSCGCSA